MTRARRCCAGLGLPVLALALCSLEPRAHADDPRTPPLALDALAYSVPLVPSTQRAVHSVLLPLDVYRGVVSPDLADVRVYDATGQELPHALRVPDLERTIDLGAHALPLFPIYADPARPADAIEMLTLRVERDAQGTVIAIGPEPAASGARTGTTSGAAGVGSAPPKPLPIAYVLDTSRLQHPINALSLQLAAWANDHVLPIVVEASDDLGTFHTVAGGQPLVRLHYGEWQIWQNRIELPGVRARYLRLRWPGHALPAPLATAVAEHGLRHEGSEQPRTRVRGTPRAGDPSVFDFDLGGPLPVDGLRVVLPEDNSVVDLETASYRVRGDEPDFIHRGIAWRVLHDGARVENPLLEIHLRTHRFYSVRVAAKGGGLGRGVPELELRYRPHQLLFVARGEAPYQLAFGHHAAKPSRFEPKELLALLPLAERDALPASDCTLGERTTRAGRAALVPPPPPPPYRRYALWGVLIAAASALVIAAVRMGRGLR